MLTFFMRINALIFLPLYCGASCFDSLGALNGQGMKKVKRGFFFKKKRDKDHPLCASFVFKKGEKITP